MNKPLCIIEAPSNLGLKQPVPGKEPGVKHLPNWLKAHGLYTLLSPKQVIRIDPLPYTIDIDPESGVSNANAIVEYSRKLSTTIQKVIESNSIPMVIGGDCSILIGCMLALKSIGTYGLFFLDGHTDFIWPALSKTAGAAGMDLAIVCGYGHQKLTDIDSMKPYVYEQHVWCVGNRTDISWYVEAIQSSRIRYVDLHTLRTLSIACCTDDFLTMVDQKHLDGFWLHFDVDVLDNTIMPAVDSPQPNGLSYEELHEMLSKLFSHPKYVGMDITILDPDLDPTGKYTKDFVLQLYRTYSLSLVKNQD